MSGDEPAPEQEQWVEARRWFAKADHDLRMAELALDASPPILDGAAFHCQQAAEKLMKGLLIAARRTPPKLHDMQFLIALLRPLYPALAVDLAGFAGLTLWYAVSRYPDIGVDLEPSEADVREALKSLTAFRNKVEALAAAGGGSSTT